MADWNLVTWLLKLDLLVRNELRGLDLEDELAVDVILLASRRGTLNGWVEFLGVDDHVDLESAALAGIYRHLHARSHIAGSGDDTLECDKSPDVGGLHVSHRNNVLLAMFSGHEHNLVVSFQLRRNLSLRVRIARAILAYEALRLFDLLLNLQVVFPLLRDDVPTRQIFLADVD